MTKGDLPTKKKRKLSENRCNGTQHQKTLPESFQHHQNCNVIDHEHSSTISGSFGKLDARIDQKQKLFTPSNTPEGMYNFPLTKPQMNGVVDLTGSSPEPQSNAKKASPSTSTPQTAFTPHQGAKKLVVKNLRKSPKTDPEQYFKKVWDLLDTVLGNVFCDGNPRHSREELYKGAENLCRQGKSVELYTRLRARCEAYLAGQTKEELTVKAIQLSNLDFLSSYLGVWKRWTGSLVTIRSIFYYMDHTYLLRNPEYPGITEMGRNLFRDHMFQDENVRSKLLQSVLELIDLDRSSAADERASSLLKSSIAMFHDLGTYLSDFEPNFNKCSERFFERWAVEQTAKDDLAAYATNSHTLFAREMTRCDIYSFDGSTRAALARQFNRFLVEEQYGFLTNKDHVMQLLEDNDASSLEHVFSLLERVGKGTDLGSIFDQYIREEGCTIVFDEKRESEMVIRLLEFKRQLDHFHRFSFHGNDSIANGLHRSFEYFMNRTKKTQASWDTDNAKPGEMIAKHIDLLLRGGAKTIPRLTPGSKDSSGGMEDNYDDGKDAAEDAEIDHHLSLALDLFRFVHGKAVFEAFYKKDLARRLLMGRSASDDAERNMLGRLKTECGAGFTHNLESMFKDMDLARDEMASYNQLQSDRGSRGSGPDLNVNVLSSAAWPSYPDVSVTIPPTISQLISDFESHYHQKHRGRKLHWKHALAHCQLKAYYPKGVRKEIVVSGFQAIVLLLFNDVPANATLSYAEIKSATSLPDAELQRTLQSLACAKYRVLTKHPKGRDVNFTDSFGYNENFTDPKTRIKINQIQLKETKEENRETHIRVAADRHYETQAAIVRIMKSRKTIGHAELVAEVIKATRTRGVLEPSDIKKNIDKLMEKDYMERTEGNNYAYVA